MNQPRLSAGARIVDRGYQHYEGARLGSPHAVWAMTRAAMARSMGLRRPFYYKIMPWLLVITANVPVIVILAVQILSRAGGEKIPAFVDLASEPFPLLYLLFAAVVGPDLYCGDRREHVLSLYFAAPITRVQYVAARTVALVVLLLALTLTPMLALFVGNALLAASTADYVRDNVQTLGHVLLAGVLVATLFGVLVSAVSSFSDRRVHAAGAFIGLLLVTALIGSILGLAIKFTGHEKFILIDLLNLGPRTVRWIFGLTPYEGSSGSEVHAVLGISGWAYLGMVGVVIVVSTAILLVRYQRMSD